MSKRFKKADAKTYGQRARSEGVDSMPERDVGSTLGSIDPERRKQEPLFTAVVRSPVPPTTENERRDRACALPVHFESRR